MAKHIPAKKVRETRKIDAADAKPIEVELEVVSDYADPKIQQQVRRYLHEAEEAVEENDYKKAVDSYNKAEKDANYPENYQIPRGRADIWRKSTETVDDRIKKRQYYLKAIEELKNSREIIERERGNHPTDTRTLNDTRNSIVSLEEEWKKEVVDIIDVPAANELLIKKEYDGALDKLKTALQLYEKHSVAWNRVAKIHEDLALTSGDDVQRSEHIAEAFRAHNKAITFAENEGKRSEFKRERREGAIRTVLYKKVGERQKLDSVEVEHITLGDYFKLTHGDLSRILDGKKAVPGAYDVQLEAKKEEEIKSGANVDIPISDEIKTMIGDAATNSQASVNEAKVAVRASTEALVKLNELKEQVEETNFLFSMSEDERESFSKLKTIAQEEKDPIYAFGLAVTETLNDEKARFGPATYNQDGKLIGKLMDSDGSYDFEVNIGEDYESYVENKEKTNYVKAARRLQAIADVILQNLTEVSSVKPAPAQPPAKPA